ncbi:hypothetical protein P3L10_015953 [Capsicum annuum]
MLPSGSPPKKPNQTPDLLFVTCSSRRCPLSVVRRHNSNNNGDQPNGSLHLPAPPAAANAIDKLDDVT